MEFSIKIKESIYMLLNLKSIYLIKYIINIINK